MYGGGHDGSTVSGAYDGSSSPDAGHSSSVGAGAASNKTIVMERHRRRRLNDRLYALRSVVPNITKVRTYVQT